MYILFELCVTVSLNEDEDDNENNNNSNNASFKKANNVAGNDY